MTKLLSVPPAKPHGTSPQRPSKEVGYSSLAASEPSPKSLQARLEPTSVPLRERLKRTRELPESLRSECLERLERIDKEIPLKLRHRPSWTHGDEHGSPPIHLNACDRQQTDASNADGAKMPDSAITADGLPRSSPEVSESAYEHAVAPSDQVQFQDQPIQRRRRQLWTVDACDLTTAASVWKSSAKGFGGPSSGKVSRQLRYTRSTQSLGGPDTSTSPLHVSEKPGIVSEEANCGMEDGGATPFRMSPQSPMRGVNSTLRSTLRCALQC